MKVVIHKPHGRSLMIEESQDEVKRCDGFFNPFGLLPKIVAQDVLLDELPVGCVATLPTIPTLTTNKATKLGLCLHHPTCNMHHDSECHEICTLYTNFLKKR